MKRDIRSLNGYDEYSRILMEYAAEILEANKKQRQGLCGGYNSFCDAINHAYGMVDAWDFIQGEKAEGYDDIEEEVHGEIVEKIEKADRLVAMIPEDRISFKFKKDMQALLEKVKKNSLRELKEELEK